ncbi:hypothetical protein CC78DRAFT_252921 [Lojkania enalia]|uniref:Uncharacterized protein n=1 Tax=Lojkania enalia TaxID=147567 RepID=A0A9P4N603_9PLEO|nr:hypothetical protein CC78DRAFT_252921 [Didymosphaeria enalia]
MPSPKREDLINNGPACKVMLQISFPHAYQTLPTRSHQWLQVCTTSPPFAGNSRSFHTRSKAWRQHIPLLSMLARPHQRIPKKEGGETLGNVQEESGLNAFSMLQVKGYWSASATETRREPPAIFHDRAHPWPELDTPWAPSSNCFHVAWYPSSSHRSAVTLVVSPVAATLQLESLASGDLTRPSSKPTADRDRQLGLVHNRIGWIIDSASKKFLKAAEAC